MRLLFSFVFCFAGTCLLAQTKEIAFKSHSGNMKNFKIVLENRELFDEDNANFGLPAPKDISTYKLDTVIFISDSASVLITTEYRKPYNKPKDPAKLWKTGKDTIYNDPLFKRKHSLDSIKTELKKTGNYINPISKVVFIGFDNKMKRSKQNNVVPFAINKDGNNNNSPFDKQLLFMLGVILFLSLAGGWLSWKLYQPKLQ